MTNFRGKPWVNPFGKMSIFRLFEHVLLYSLERPFFALQYHKTHFPGLYCLKKTDGKIANFWAKPWVIPFGKMSIFRFFKLVVFWTCSFFLVLEYHKTHFRGLYCLKKKMEKLPIFEQNHGLNPLEKCQFFDFFNFLFLLPRNAFFRSRISWNTFSWPILSKKKNWKNDQFLSKTMG